MKTLSIIAVAGLASVAAADFDLAQAPGTNSVVRTTTSGFVSGTYTYTFGDTEHFGLIGDPANFIDTIDLNALLGGAAGADAFVTGIAWDVSVTSTDPSWLSEAGYSFNGEINLTPGAGDDFSGAASYSNPVVDLTDNGLADILATGGVLNIEFFESFDDASVSPDSVTSGSITLVVDYKVPAPAGLAVLGLGGLVAARRRR